MIGKKKISKKKISSWIIFLIGFLMCSYPLVRGLIEQQYQNDTVATYEKTIKEAKKENIDDVLKDAKEYNSILHQTDGIIISDIDSGILSEDNYNNILNPSGNGVMGSVEIPKINVNLPIYHGTNDEVLNVGVGHVMETSFPIGGENTRAVLTGHRGLPNSKLFTRLDEMEIGDLFFLRVLDEILAYRICEIDVIEPEEVNKIEIVDGKDLVTLLTCTPYGINTHRLIVTGERVAYEKAEHDAIESEIMSFRELFFACVPFLFIAIVIVRTIKNIIKSKKKEVEKHETEQN